MGLEGFHSFRSKSGYVYRLKIYTGKSEVTTDEATLGLSSRAVICLMNGLMNGLFDKSHELYTDSYYTSP